MELSGVGILKASTLMKFSNFCLFWAKVFDGEPFCPDVDLLKVDEESALVED